jgi:hypothetical protein
MEPTLEHTTGAPRGQDPLDPATYAGTGVLGQLLAAGHRVTYAEDLVWPGCWYADLRDAKGRCVETGGGATQAEALASLRERCERSEPAALGLAAAPAPREDLTAEDRGGMIGVMTEAELGWALSFIAGFAPGVFDSALAARSEAFADELPGRVDAKLAGEAAADPQGYCTTCGENAGHFIGYEGPRHFRGEGTAASPAELLDAGHEPAVAWRYPDGDR